MSLWKSNFGSTYQNLPRYLKSLTFLFPWIAKAISMHQNVHWSFYSLPAEFFKNSVKMISSRLHLKFHQISNWQWNRKCIFLTIIPLICLFLRLGYVRTYTLVGGSSDLWNVVIFLMVKVSRTARPKAHRSSEPCSEQTVCTPREGARSNGRSVIASA